MLRHLMQDSGINIELQIYFFCEPMEESGEK